MTSLGAKVLKNELQRRGIRQIVAESRRDRAAKRPKPYRAKNVAAQCDAILRRYAMTGERISSLVREYGPHKPGPKGPHSKASYMARMRRLIDQGRPQEALILFSRWEGRPKEPQRATG